MTFSHLNPTISRLIPSYPVLTNKLLRYKYACVWFDIEGGRRALVAEREGTYRLRVEEFEARAEEWRAISGVSVFSSLPEVKRALFFDYDFACKENAVLDAHGDVVFRDD